MVIHTYGTIKEAAHLNLRGGGNKSDLAEEWYIKVWKAREVEPSRNELLKHKYKWVGAVYTGL